jgi:hypothetical protein
MGLHYWREGGLAVVRYEGTYEAHAALRAIDEVLAESDDAAAGLLLDLSASESFITRSSAELRTIAQFLAERRERFSSRVAAVGESDLTFGMLRMGMVYVADLGMATEAFRSREKAMAWLGQCGSAGARG